MELNSLINNAKFGEITAVVGSNIENVKVLPNYDNEAITVTNHFSKYCDKEKLLKAFKVLNVQSVVSNFMLCDLSLSLKNKLAIVEALVSKENTLVFYNVHKGLSYREQQEVKRILKKLAEHKKKVIIITSEVEFLLGLTKIVFAEQASFYADLTPINWLDVSVYDYIAKPPIIEFVMNCQKRSIKIDNCYETKELLKAIYRSVDK